MEFTKKELHEIQQRFDIHSGDTVKGVAWIAERLKDVPQSNKLLTKVFKEVTEDYDMFRTISAKCQKMLEELNYI